MALPFASSPPPFSLKSLLSRSPVSCSSFLLSPRPRNPYLTSSPLSNSIETFSTSSFLTLVFWLLLGSFLTSPVPALLSSPPMAGTVVASPLCTWMAAACMSVACDEERPLGRWNTFPGRRRWATALSSGEGRGSPRRLISEFRASGIQGLMSSCLAFEPCAEFYNSRNGSAFFGKNGLSLFGPWKTESIRRQQRASRSSPSSGNDINDFCQVDG